MCRSEKLGYYSKNRYPCDRTTILTGKVVFPAPSNGIISPKIFAETTRIHNEKVVWLGVCVDRDSRTGLT